MVYSTLISATPGLLSSTSSSAASALSAKTAKLSRVALSGLSRQMGSDGSGHLAYECLTNYCFPHHSFGAETCSLLQTPQETRGNVITNPFTRDNFVNPFGCGQTSSLYQDRFQAFVFIGPEVARPSHPMRPRPNVQRRLSCTSHHHR